MFGLCKKDTVSRKEIRADFYRCRDFELANLWQRSIFLSAFLILGFTGYGYVLLKIIEIISSNDANKGSLPYLHLVAIGIGVLNLLFSILWIMMGKGSKAWYEIYETAICDIDKEIIEDGNDKYRMGNLALKKKEDFDNKLSSGKAGPFSVSKINIGIGQICLLVWGIVIVVHSIALFQYEMLIIGFSIILFVIMFDGGNNWFLKKMKDKFKSGYNFFNDN